MPKHPTICSTINIEHFPSTARRWLNDTPNLTTNLAQRFTDYQFTLLEERFDTLLPYESYVIQETGPAWVREACHQHGQSILVYTRLCVPQASFEKRKTAFLSLKESPIGLCLLLKETDIKRSAFYHFSTNMAGYLARASSFQWGTETFMITETFTPELLSHG